VTIIWLLLPTADDCLFVCLFAQTLNNKVQYYTLELWKFRGKCPPGEKSAGKKYSGEMSVRGKVRRGKCPRGKSPGGIEWNIQSCGGNVREMRGKCDGNAGEMRGKLMRWKCPRGKSPKIQMNSDSYTMLKPKNRDHGNRGDFNLHIRRSLHVGSRIYFIEVWRMPESIVNLFICTYSYIKTGNINYRFIHWVAYWVMVSYDCIIWLSIIWYYHMIIVNIMFNYMLEPRFEHTKSKW
jgi:hypothetical protein